MTVFVDDMYKGAMGEFRGMKMSHMVADSTVELYEMADQIGVQRKWIQYPGTWKEHFDIALTKRTLAVKLGAREITFHELGVMMNARVKVRRALLTPTPLRGPDEPF